MLSKWKAMFLLEMSTWRLLWFVSVLFLLASFHHQGKLICYFTFIYNLVKSYLYIIWIDVILNCWMSLSRNVGIFLIEVVNLMFLLQVFVLACSGINDIIQLEDFLFPTLLWWDILENFIAKITHFHN